MMPNVLEGSLKQPEGERENPVFDPKNWPICVFACLEIVRSRLVDGQNHYNATDIQSSGVLDGNTRYIWAVSGDGSSMRLTVEMDTFRGDATRKDGSVPMMECTTPSRVIDSFKWDA